MFPYIKLTLIDGGEMWIHHKTIVQVYFDENDETTSISTTTEDHDFSVSETIDEVIEMLRAFYPEESYHHSIGSGVNNIAAELFNSKIALL